jgi:RND superfamily putative drug exporter
VAKGIAHTARPIAAAAFIMAAVFGCFLVADVLELKEFGFALAVAVVLDATLVRLLLVPAFMKLAGKANWWLPALLDRRLPQAGSTDAVPPRSDLDPRPHDHGLRARQVEVLRGVGREV